MLDLVFLTGGKKQIELGCSVEISLGDFVKYLVLLLHKNNIVFTLRSYRPWHHLFWRLKKDPAVSGRPAFFEKLWFDWDGPYPESPELSEYLDALLRVGCIESASPRFEKYWLTERMASLWLFHFEALDDQTKIFLNNAAVLAQEEFQKNAE